MGKKYYKIVDGKIIFADNVIIYNGEQIFWPSEDILIAAGYQEYEEDESEQTEYDAEKQALIDEMNILKRQLTDEDYKIIKCSEAFMSGNELPYDLEDLITKRNNRRSRINEIENLLNN